MVDVDLINAFRLISTGSSAVESSLGIENIKAGVKRYSLTRAGGAGDQDHALRLGEGLHKQALFGSWPRASMPILALDGSNPQTIFSPQRVGRLLTRKSMAFLLDIFNLMRPSWGRRRS